jgi:hypothetical protein
MKRTSKSTPSIGPATLLCVALPVSGFCCLAFSYAGTDTVLLGMVGTLLTFFGGLVIGLKANS